MTLSDQEFFTKVDEVLNSKDVSKIGVAKLRQLRLMFEAKKENLVNALSKTQQIIDGIDIEILKR